MRKWLFATGLILSSIGLILITMSNLSYQKSSVKWKTVETEEDTWQILYNFTQGDIVKLVIYPSPEWTRFLEPETPEVPFPSKTAYANITDPNGRKSMFEVVFVRTLTSTFLTLYNVKLVSSSNVLSTQGIEDLLEGKAGIVGMALHDGQYTAKVLGFLPPMGGPPSVLTFLKGEKVDSTEYLYPSFLHYGVITLSVGVVLSILGAKASKRRVLRRRRIRARA